MRRLLILIVLLANTLLSFAQNGLRGRVVEADPMGRRSSTRP